MTTTNGGEISILIAMKVDNETADEIIYLLRERSARPGDALVTLIAACYKLYDEAQNFGTFEEYIDRLCADLKRNMRHIEGGGLQ